MKVFLVVDETSFFHPRFIADVIARSQDEFVGAALVTKISGKSNIGSWLLRNWYHLRPHEMLKLFSQSVYAKVMDTFRPGAFHSVRSVLKHHGIDFREVHYDINKPEHLDFIRSKSPDVIVSSCSVIFKA